MPIRPRQSERHGYPAMPAILVYQLALLYRAEQGVDLNVGLKAFLKAA